MSPTRVFSADRFRRLRSVRAAALALPWLCLLLALGTAGCWFGGSVDSVPTQSIEFQADPHINDGQLLPVDIVYVTYLHQLRELTSLGARAWFESPDRGNWLAKESFGMRGGDHILVKLNQTLLAKSPYLVVFAAFKGVKDPGREQVIFDYESFSQELIYVRNNRLEPENPALQELY